MVERIIEQKQGERLKVFCSKKDKRMNGYLSENKVKGTDFSFMKNDIFSRND